jgi:hypothetical protein
MLAGPGPAIDFDPLRTYDTNRVIMINWAQHDRTAPRRSFIRPHRWLATALTAGSTLVVLAACSPAGAGTSGAGGGSDQPPNAGSSAPPGARARDGVPGVSGKIVARSGSTIQVRTVSGQNAVSFTGKTSVNQEKPAKASDVAVGVCATVRSVPGTGADTTASTITAASVNLSEPVSGGCRAGFGGFGGAGRPNGRPSGAAGTRSDAPPSGSPSGGAPSGAPRGFGGAGGLVTAVSGSSMTVEEVRGTAGTTTKVTVALTADTTYTRQVKAGTDAITTGQCVLATGPTDSTGAMAATAIRLSPPVNGVCGFTRRGQGPSSGSSAGG